MREQLKVIQDELGDTDGIKAEVEEYKQKINKLKTVKDTKEKLMKEVDRFSKMPPSSAESSVLRNYLDTVLSLPWNKLSKESFDIKNAEKILNEDHYGLEKVKERVLEYLAVRQNTKGKNGTILCFAGPPGVGKTSVAKSIARSLGRKYVRISLGGIHDESDIRGHRKTYIGAMEGRIIAAMKEAKQKIRLFCLTKLIKWVRIIKVIRQPHFWKCLTMNKTEHSATIILKCRLICHRCCLSQQQIHLIRFQDRCLTEWKSLNFRAIQAMKNSILQRIIL